ncbi:stonustoxin subunit beta-like isoform X2 [Amphiprion ocellaris]|uniref:stonustoxin subunit beta-like isoform X2 n=1 Tax=Amphiprion ocellaris TaxID=80972 RepID=UPI0024110289|nr:stonustoxin subunit beta-like isoform X2 [Amphiprion ocellaris]
MPSGPNSAFIISETSKPGKIIKSNNNEKAKAEKVSVYLPNIPEPTSRAELMQYWMNFTLDDKTANKMLWISDGGSKVCRRTEEVCPVLDRPERYEYSPQVLCKEGIWNMRAYWEVEYSGWVVIGVTYEGAGRRADTGPSGLGENEESWVGVYIDQPAGIISFYAVTGEGAEREVKLLHKVKSTIEKKILPGFWMGIQSSCTLLKRAE